MLQLDGYPLIGDNVDLEIQDFVNRFINTESFHPWNDRQFPGWGLAALTLPLGARTHQPYRLNRFVWPSGAARWAYGHFLCNSDTVAKILPDAISDSSGSYNQIPFEIGNTESNEGGTIFSGDSITINVFLLPPTPLSGIRGLSIQNTGTQSLYLLTIVDPRYFWWWSNWGNLVVSKTTKWQDLIDGISANLDITIKVDSISAAYLQPSIQAFSLPYEPLPMILDAIAYNIGMRFVANYDGTYAMQLYQTAVTSFNNSVSASPDRSMAAGGYKLGGPL